MRLLKYELYKVFTAKLFWGALIAVLLVNVASLMWLNQPEGLPHSETRAMFDTIRVMERDDKVEYLREHKDLLEYFNLRETLESTREMVASGTNILATYDEVIAIESQMQELRERFGDRLNRNISSEAATAQISLIEQVIRELTTTDYADFLDNVDRTAELSRTLNIFADENSFEFRNIQKTQADFEGMRDIAVQYDVNLGLNTLNLFGN